MKKYHKQNQKASDDQGENVYNSDHKQRLISLMYEEHLEPKDEKITQQKNGQRV